MFSLLSFLPHCLCRAIIIRNNEVVPMTNEFTPESERQRLQYLVFFIFYSTQDKYNQCAQGIFCYT